MSFPNFMSVLRMILSPCFFVLFQAHDNLSKRIAFILFFVAVLTDWYDGWHARKFKSVTKIGIFIDPLADKILTTFAFALFCKLNIMPLWMFMLIAVRDIYVTLLRSYDEYRGKTMKTTFIAKLKTAFQMTYIFAVLFLLIIYTFDISEEIKDSILYFLKISTGNYILMLMITIITLYTGIAYFFERKFVNDAFD